jgi:hypothetical protein
MIAWARLRSPVPEVFNRLRVLQDRIPRVPSLLQPIRELEENYAKIVRRHSSSAVFPEKDERVHG